MGDFFQTRDPVVVINSSNRALACGSMGILGKMANLQNGSVIVVRHLHKFLVFWGP